MKILFLDIDGVLNTVKDLNPDYINPAKASLVNGLCQETGTVIVISSSWRLASSWNMFSRFNVRDDAEAMQRTMQHLRAAGITVPIIGATPGVYSIGLPTSAFRFRERECEIQAWLDQHPGTQTFAILDDDASLKRGLLAPHLVSTSEAIGVMVEHIVKLRKLLEAT
jgi:hypothetical protein